MFDDEAVYRIKVKYGGIMDPTFGGTTPNSTETILAFIKHHIIFFIYHHIIYNTHLNQNIVLAVPPMSIYDIISPENLAMSAKTRKHRRH